MLIKVRWPYESQGLAVDCSPHAPDMKLVVFFKWNIAVDGMLGDFQIIQIKNIIGKSIYLQSNLELPLY